MKRNKLAVILLYLAVLTACSSVKSLNITMEEMAWDTIDVVSEKQNKTIAVYYFTYNGEIHSLSNYVINGLSTELANAVNEENLELNIVTRQSIDKILAELKYQATDLTDEKTQVEIGKQLGADIIITGEITPIEGDVYNINAQIIEIESAKLLGGIVYDFWWDNTVNM